MAIRKPKHEGWQRHESAATVPQILYEDNHLLVVHKPPGMACQSGSGTGSDLLSVLKQDIKERHGKPGAVFLGLVHRLDQPVGGVMVFARTSKGASRISHQIRERTFQKSYLAVVDGVPTPPAGHLEHYLYKDQHANTVKISTAADPHAKLAVLDYSVLQTINHRTLVRIALHTGRPHQIRVQMAAIGTPLTGDRKYGASAPEYPCDIALWACRIAFTHPTQARGMHFECAPPDVYPWSAFDIATALRASSR
jgi:23S rRNA pseudouridine1911/1915/1917 synthase